MKLVDLKCPNCGGRLMPVEGNTKIVVCEYCKSQYILEDDRVINYHVHQHIEPPGRENRQTDSPNPVVALSATLIFAGVVFLFLVGLGTVNRNILMKNLISRSAFESASAEEMEEQKEQRRTGSAFYDELIQSIYGKTADEVTSEELGKLRCLSIRNTRDAFLVDFSLESPYGEREPAVRSASLKPADWNPEDLVNFPNLERLEISGHWTDKGVPGELKNLKGFSCQGGSPAELARWLDPQQLLELEMAEPESLEGLSAFVNLRILSLEKVTELDLRQLAALEQLDSLEIVERVESNDLFSEEKAYHVTDYSALSVLTGLKRLYLESEAIRDVGFLKSLTGLEELSLRKTEAISLDSLANLSQLTVLELEDNDSLKNYDFMPALSELKSLALNKSASQPDPDLSGLVQLERLDVSGLISVAPLGHLTNLRELSIHGCNIDEIQSLSSLTALERLACYSVWTYSLPLENISFLDGMTSLRYLDLCGVSDERGWGGYGHKMEIYGDISSALNHVGLEELYLNEGMFGIDFDRLQENPSLKKLQLNDIALKENFHVEVYAGIKNIWYDDVTLDEHTDFLKLYPNLEELDLEGNQLTHIRFASDLKKLTRLGLSNNYVTDLTPLNQVEDLQYLDIRQNPVNSMPEAGGDIEIVR